MNINYKDYQQVIHLNTRKSKPSKPKSLISNKTKKRTKTGCLTCRKRKKKCDESKVDGKCTACHRNFLECCWPTPSSPLSSPRLSSSSCSLSDTESVCSDSSDLSESSVTSLSSLSSNDSSYKTSIEHLLNPTVPSYKISKPQHNHFHVPKRHAELAEAKTKFIITSIDFHSELHQIA